MENKKIVVALAGNPNSGKTTIFNDLTGARQHVGNWPGVTVEKKEGHVTHNGCDMDIVDLPGTYSLRALGEDEQIARDFLLDGGADVAVCVADAWNLERSLYLVVQLIEMGVRVVLNLNMIDVAERRGIQIDEEKLSTLLGTPVVSTNGAKRRGVNKLLDVLAQQAAQPTAKVPDQQVLYPSDVEDRIKGIETYLQQSAPSSLRQPVRWLAMKLLERDPDIEARMKHLISANGLAGYIAESRDRLEKVYGDSVENTLASYRYGFISGLTKQVVKTDIEEQAHLSEKIDTILTNRILGPVFLVAVLYLMFQFTFLGSEPLVAGLKDFFGWLGESASKVIPEGLLQSLVVSGIIDGVGGVLVFTPVIALMFLAISIIEDSGYMARIAFMLDRILRAFGLHGSSMLALIVSGGIAGGCAVPGVMATRTMREPKERLITILITPLFNCGAKLPVYALLIAAFFNDYKADMMLILTLFSWIVALAAAKVMSATVLAGPSAPFILELPPYHIPTLRGILIHTWERVWMYLKKAATIILGISILLWAMMTFPSLPDDQQKVFDDRLEALKTEAAALPSDSEAASGLEDMKKELQEKQEAIENEMRAAQLRHTLAGRIGLGLEYVFSPMGFDWKTNIALVGGFAAKEVVVSTLGTAYSLGKIDPEESGSLAETLQKDPGWNTVKALSFMVFVMFYAPCMATLVVMRKETGTWRWPGFAVVYTIVLAYVLALCVRSSGFFLTPVM